MRNSDVAHYWANQNRASANGSNFSFDGATIYSYSTPIGHIVENNGRRLYLHNTKRYSVTTSKHQTYAISATYANGIRVFVDTDIDFVKYANDETILDRVETYLVTQIKNTLLDLNNKRKKVTNILSVVFDIYEELNTLLTFYRKPNNYGDIIVSFVNESKRIDKVLDTLDDLISYVNELTRTEREKRQNISYKTFTTCLEEWRKGKRQSLGRFYDGVKTYLRLCGDQVQTSKGIRFTIDDARRFWTAIKFSISHQIEKEVEWLGFKGTVYPTGDIKIGCHCIDYSEIETLAKQLKLC